MKRLKVYEGRYGKEPGGILRISHPWAVENSVVVSLRPGAEAAQDDPFNLPGASDFELLAGFAAPMNLFVEGSTAGTFGIEVVNPNGGRSLRFTFSTR